jgi:LPXTG-site transpeptidase (sortase) family protein
MVYAQQERNPGCLGCGLRMAVLLMLIGGIGFFLYRQFGPAGYEPSPLATLPPLDGITEGGSTSGGALIAQDESSSASASGQTVPVSNGLTQNNIGDSSLFIPSLAINAPITQVYLDGTTWDVSALGMNVGHLQGTAWIDDGPGNVVLSGHVELRDGRRGVFAGIDDLAVGDLIILERGGQELRYSVTELREVEPTDLTPLMPTTDDRLTLITCSDYNFFSDSYETRQVIVATRMS